VGASTPPDSGDGPLPRQNESTLETYLREINRYPLLTREEEVELGTRVQAGDPEAREQMIRANLRLVVALAKRYRNRGLSLMDLVEEGNIGLVKAVERFDPEAGVKFSTYGAWWIKQAVRRALVNTSRMVRLPSYMVELISKFKARGLEMQESMGHAPSTQEIALDMGLAAESLVLLKRALRAANSPGGAFSLDAMLEDRDTLPDYRQEAPDQAILDAHELEQLQNLLDTIDPREAEILKLRYGLNEDGPLTLREIGERFGVSRERVRQIERRALKKLNDHFTGKTSVKGRDPRRRDD